MSRLSLTDWYRYLETQYADDEPEPQPSEPSAEASPQASPAASAEPITHRDAPVEPTPAMPMPAEVRRDALVSIRVPDFAEFVPLIEQEVGRKPLAALAPLTDDDLEGERPYWGGGRMPTGDLCLMLAEHDAYHAGQIVYIRGMYAAQKGK